MKLHSLTYKFYGKREIFKSDLDFKNHVLLGWAGRKVNTLIRWDWNTSDFYHKLNFFSVHFSFCQPHLFCVINMRSFSPHNLYHIKLPLSIQQMLIEHVYS